LSTFITPIVWRQELLLVEAAAFEVALKEGGGQTEVEIK
jgi:hypothetical protein